MDWSDFDAALFDLDGVITPTAEVHLRAWTTMFDAYLASRGDAGGPFTEQDYLRYVDGKPRYDGVRSFLASRGVVLPEGESADPPSAETVCGLGNRKDAEVNRLLEAEGVRPFPGSVALLDALETLGKGLAVVSSSKNAKTVLAAARLLDRFGVVVDGVVAAAEGLPGKPAPQTFLAAADLLGVPAQRCVVVEDALSGVEAGKAGKFGLVVGVDRGAGAGPLREHGADVVVADLAELLPET